MEWRHSVSTCPKKFWVKNSLENFSSQFFGIKRCPPHWLYSKGPNYRRGVLIISAGAIEGHFEGKKPRKVTKVVWFLHNNALAHRTLTTENKLAYVCFECLDHPPHSPDLVPSHYHLFSGLKTMEGSQFFFRSGSLCRGGDLIGRTGFWFFWVAYKS